MSAGEKRYSSTAACRRHPSHNLENKGGLLYPDHPQLFSRLYVTHWVQRYQYSSARVELYPLTQKIGTVCAVLSIVSAAVCMGAIICVRTCHYPCR